MANPTISGRRINRREWEISIYFNQNGYVYDDLESECSGLIHGRSWSSSGRVSAQAQSLTVGVAGSSVVVGLHCSRQERNSVDACSSMELEKLR